MPPSSERARRILFLGDKNEINLNRFGRKSEGVVFLYHSTPLLRNGSFFGVSPIATPRNVTGYGRGGGEYPIKLRRDKTVQNDTFNPLPLLIADEIGGVPARRGS